MFAAAVVSPSELRRAPKLGRHSGGTHWVLWGGLRRGQKPSVLWVKSSNVCVTLNTIFNNSRICCRLKLSVRDNPNSKDEGVSTCDVEGSPGKFRGAGGPAACEMGGQRVPSDGPALLWFSQLRLLPVVMLGILLRNVRGAQLLKCVITGTA